MIAHSYLDDCLYKTLKQFLHKRKIHQCLTNFQSNVEKNTRRRIVVTGMGVVSPIGCSTKTAWANILNGYCGIKSLNDPVYKSLPCTIAAKIDDKDLKIEEQFSKTELRSIAPSTLYALIAGNFEFCKVKLKK